MINFGQGQGQGGGSMDDKTIVDDCLSTQKFMSSTQNTYANEAASTELRADILNILNEEHQLQAQLFQAASQRGWYNPKRASDQEIAQAQSKFTQQQGGQGQQGQQQGQQQQTQGQQGQGRTR